MTSSTAPIKDDASKIIPPVTGPEVKKDEPAKAPAASADKK